MQNVVQVGRGRYQITFENVSIGGETYSAAVFVFRLLTFTELARVWSLDTVDKQYETFIEDDIFDTIFEGILGFDDSTAIDKNSLDAGVVTTLVSAAIHFSKEYVNKIEESVQREKDDISDLEKINGFVSKAFFMPLENVERMPINKVIRYFALNISINEELQNAQQNQE